jgi:aryl-alcohol dehydrogenase-like predicted oxidoreductase
MIGGRATPAGTRRFAERFPEFLTAGHFREVGGLWLSSIGLGTYLGEATAARDRDYEEAVAAVLAAGCNVIDSAINYRHQRSERAVGRALARAIERGVATRDEVFLSTKGGFLPFDGEEPGDAGDYLRRTYLASGLVSPGELVAGCHAVAPRFLSDQLGRSLTNLGIATADLYYLHNPETQLAETPRAAFDERLRAAFTQLEAEAAAGRLAGYGIATWDGLRGRDAGERLHLERVAALVGEAAGSAERHFAAVQLPVNLALPEGLVAPTQELDGASVPALVAARRLGLHAFASASILQGRLARRLPPEIADAFPGLRTDAQRALQFSRSAPGVAVALVGMATAEHVRENLELASIPPAGPEAFAALFGGAAP